MSLCCTDVIRFLLSLSCNNFTFISRVLQPFFYIFINIPNQQLVLLSRKRNSHVTIFEMDCKILKKACFLLIFKFLVYFSAYGRPFGRTAEETQKKNIFASKRGSFLIIQKWSSPARTAPSHKFALFTFFLLP